MSNYEEVKAREYARLFVESLKEAINSEDTNIFLKKIEEIKGDKEVRLFVVKKEIGNILNIPNPYSLTSSLEVIALNIFNLSRRFGFEEAMEMVKKYPYILNCDPNKLEKKIEEYPSISKDYGISLERLLSLNEEEVNKLLIKKIMGKKKREKKNNNERKRKENTNEDRLIKTFEELKTDPTKIITLRRAAQEMKVSPQTLLKALKKYGRLEEEYRELSSKGRTFFIHNSFWSYLQKAILTCLLLICEETYSQSVYIRSGDILKLLRKTGIIKGENVNGYTLRIINELIESLAPPHYHLSTRKGTYHIFSKNDIIDRYNKENIDENEKERSLKSLAILLYSPQKPEDFSLQK